MAIQPTIEELPESEFCPGFIKITVLSSSPAGGAKSGGKMTSAASIKDTTSVIEKWFQDLVDRPCLLSTADGGDSFSLVEAPGLSKGRTPQVRQHLDKITTQLVELFGGRPQHVLLQMNSSSPAGIEAPSSSQSIFSFSVNPERVCKELSAPFVDHETLRTVSKQGKRLRLRLDPLIPVPDWRSCYEDYIRYFAWEKGVIHPKVFTLGSLRFAAAHYRILRAREGDLLKYVDFDKKGGGMLPYRVPYGRRRDMYEFVVRLLRQHLPGVRIGLCNEPEEMRDACEAQKRDCNCQL